MSAQIYDLNIKLNAETVQFRKDVEYANKALRGYADEAKAANDSNGKFVDSLERTADSAKLVKTSITTVAGAVTAFVAGTSAAVSVFVRQQAEQARELQRMATVTQLSVEQVQAMNYAAEQYNISGDKMADILKDVNDKLGDFNQNEGGEFADFFNNILPKVGLTAEKLQSLSGPEALIAVKQAMDEANVPMKDQIFYLESIADEASALMPLLENNGRKLYELKGHYDDLNVSMSNMDMQSFKEMDQNFTDVGLKFQKSFRTATLGVSNQIDWLSKKLLNAVDYWGRLFDSMSDDPKTEAGLTQKLGDLRSQAMPLRKQLAYLETQSKNIEENSNNWQFWNVGKSNQVNNQIKNLRSQLKVIDDEIDKYQKKYDVAVLGVNYKDTPAQPDLLTGNDGNGSYTPQKNTYTSGTKLDSMDSLYADDLGKLRISHQQRLDEIDNFNIKKSDLLDRGFTSEQELKQSYREAEKGYYQTQLTEYQEQKEKELQAFFDAEDKKEQASREAAERRKQLEKNLNLQQANMYLQSSSQFLDIMSSTAKEGSGIQKAAFLGTKAIAAAEVLIQGQVAGMAALSPIYGLGSPAGLPLKAAIEAMSYASAAMIMAQGVSGMAHSGMDYIPSEGTWLLNKGERVYTNDSARQVDAMYAAIMSMQRHFIAANDADYGQLSMLYQNMAGAYRQQTPANQSNQTSNQSSNAEYHFHATVQVTGTMNDETQQLTMKNMKSTFKNLLAEERRPGGLLYG